METSKEHFQSGTEMAKSFVEYLVEKGYPRDSIAVEYRINNVKCRADIAILGQKTESPIELFELKRRTKNIKEFTFGRKQLELCRSGLNNRNIPAYLVFSKDTEPFFDIVDIDNVDKEVILNYNGRKIAGESEERNIKKKEQKDDITKYSFIYLIFEILLLLLICVPKILLCYEICPFILDTNDIIIIGIAAALLLVYTVPYIQIKLDSLGLELGFKKSNEKK